MPNLKGEPGDHFIEFSSNDIHDPNMVICAGIRWLFNKRSQASSNLNRKASWIEAVAKYKNELSDFAAGKPAEGMDVFLKYFRRIKSQ